MTAARASISARSATLVAVLLLVSVAVLGAACSDSPSGRPETSATLQILTPAPNATTRAAPVRHCAPEIFGMFVAALGCGLLAARPALVTASSFGVAPFGIAPSGSSTVITLTLLFTALLLVGALLPLPTIAARSSDDGR